MISLDKLLNICHSYYKLKPVVPEHHIRRGVVANGGSSRRHKSAESSV